MLYYDNRRNKLETKISEAKPISLNDVQREAVLHTEGPLLILAGAGTGKTSVIINRVGHILTERLASASEILATTFTNKASKEMRDRIFNIVPYEMPWLGTFHSIAAKILRLHHDVVALSSTFSIIDSDDQIKLIKRIIVDLNIDPSQYNYKIIHNTIQRWKDLSLFPEQVSESDIKSDCDRIALQVYRSYQPKLGLMDAVDFGDILIKNIEIFRKDPNVLAYYQGKFKYIMVDEYQDTNAAQYIWLRMLVQPRNNICCVGDDDQSIYGWRGAEIGNILRFEEDFPNAKLVKLEQNYRSTKHILNVASSLISHNRIRHGKTLWTSQDSNSSDQKVYIKSCWNDKQEAQFIANKIMYSDSKDNLSQVSVLVRAMFQTRIIEECLLSNLVPYKVIGSLKFYDRLEVKDILAYVKLASKTNDDISFERIINKPARSIGKTSIQKIRVIANEKFISMYSAANLALEDPKLLGAKTRSALSGFLGMLRKWNEDFRSLSHVDVVRNIIAESGYEEMLNKDETDAGARIDNIKELVKAIGEYGSISEFLEHIALISDNDDKAKQNQSMISIMSLHASKGLEFDTVFLPGWEEGLFPNAKTLEEVGSKGLEEERRLAYVGITRARRKLYISYTSGRRVFNQWTSPIPSRFLKELPQSSCIMYGSS